MGWKIKLEAKCTDSEDSSIGLVIDWDAGQNPGTLVTRPNILADGTVTTFSQTVPDNRDYSVSVKATDSSGALSEKSIDVSKIVITPDPDPDPDPDPGPGPGAKESKLGFNSNFIARDWYATNPFRSDVNFAAAWNSGTANGVTNVNPWRQDWLDMLDRYSVCRTMNWCNVNRSLVQNWSQVMAPTNQNNNNTLGFGLQGVSSPLSYEWQIDLCNRKNMDLWLNVPHLSWDAKEDYWVKLAKLIKQRLNPGLKVIPEYSNEVWNVAWDGGSDWRSNQTVWVASKGGYAGTAKPADGGDWTGFFNNMRDGFTAATKDLWEIFDREIGRDRVYHILAGQRVGNDVEQKVIKAKAAGMAIDGIAIAPYFGSALNPSAADIWGKINADIDGHITTVMNTMRALADQHSIQLWCYEGGQEITGKGVADTRPVNSNPAMYNAYKRWLNVVVPKADRVISYKIVTRESEDFAFGESRDIAAPLSSEHKLRAIADYAKEHGWEDEVVTPDPDPDPGPDPEPDPDPDPDPGVKGLFYTTAELNEWNKRRLSGPYKKNWDNRIYAGAQKFMTGKKDTAPWAGQTSVSCWTPVRPTVDPDTGYGPRGMWAGQAAFVYRVLKHAGDDVRAAPYFNKVKNYLLAHTTTPGINFKDGRRFCASSSKRQGVMQFFSGWVRRIAVTYSWIKEDMSAADRAKFEDWLLGGGKFLLGHVEFMLGYSYSNPWGGSNHPTCNKSACPGPQRAPPWLYDGGPPHYQMNDNWNNRASVTASAVGIVGLVTGDVGLKDKAKRFFELSLKYAVWPDGTYVDIIRVSPEPQVGFGYASDYLGSMCVLADALARTGDNSLYEYETRGGSLAGCGSNAGQPAKNIKQVTKHLAGQVDWSIRKYGKGKPRIPSNVINPYNTVYGDGSLSDLYMIQPNLYYKNDYIKSIYRRTAPGTQPRAKRPSSGWDYYTGDWGVLPDVEFMWDGLAGQVWPY